MPADKKCFHYVGLRKGVLALAAFDIVFAVLCSAYFLAVAICFGKLEDDDEQEFEAAKIKARIALDLIFTLIFLVLQVLVIVGVAEGWHKVLLLSMGASVGSLCFLLGRCVFEVSERYLGTLVIIIIVCALTLYFMYVVLDYVDEMDV